MKGRMLSIGSSATSRHMFMTLMTSSRKNSRMWMTAKPSRLSSKALRSTSHRRTRSHRTKTPKQNGRLASRSSRPCCCSASYATNPFARTKRLTTWVRSSALFVCATGWRSRRPQALLDRLLEPTRFNTFAHAELSRWWRSLQRLGTREPKAMREAECVRVCVRVYSQPLTTHGRCEVLSWG